MRAYFSGNESQYSLLFEFFPTNWMPEKHFDFIEMGKFFPEKQVDFQIMLILLRFKSFECNVQFCVEKSK